MSDATTTPSPAAKPPGDPKKRIVEALMELAAERRWEEIAISDVANRAHVTLSEFRDAFPSKGAALAGFSRMIDKKVLEGTTDDLAAESPRDRLFDVLMRRLDAMAPYKEGLRAISEWARRDPLSAVALNGVALNSMRFMMEAAGLDSEGPLGNVKLQGLVLAWTRVLETWFDDEDPALDRTMATLDEQLARGGRIVARLDDVWRLTAPLRTFGGAMMSGRRTFDERIRERWPDRRRDMGADI
ncbi:MAG: TetR/AcrR family transcriptional regulator [Beijerinckiaceae bacterium]|nr:TetR/AcrR family transcriptional regulator [Beijerinckiaceae bacterium]